VGEGGGKRTSGFIIPPLCLIQVRCHADTDFGVVAKSVLRVSQALLRCFARPQVRLGIGLHDHTVGTGEVPPAQGERTLFLVLHCCAAIPGYALVGIDRAAHGAILEGAADAEL